MGEARITYPAIPVKFTLCPWEDQPKQWAVKHGANHSVWGFDVDSDGYLKQQQQQNYAF